MTKWFDWLAGVNLLMIGILLEKVDFNIMRLLELRHPVNVFLLIVSVLLATGLSIVAYYEHKDARKIKRQKKTIRNTFNFIAYTSVMFILVYISWFMARLILSSLGQEKVYSESPLILFLATLIISPFIFYLDKIKKAISTIFKKKLT